MCIIVYKPMEKAMPSKQILKHCWDNNEDGAGYMFPNGKDVIIKKGFMKFDSFYEALKADYKKVGRFTPFVLHFRVSTQAGVNEECTHPFPLSREMDDLRKTRATCKIGIAHNGIIELTKSGYYTTVTYSDTMKFITDYAALLIKDKDFYKDEDTLKLLDRLVKGRLAIMDYEGHVQLIGDFVEDDGIYYSNNYYKEDRAKKTKTTNYYYDNYYYYGAGGYYDRNGWHSGTPKTTKLKEPEKPLEKTTSDYKATQLGFKVEEDKKNDKEEEVKVPTKQELAKLSDLEKGKVLDNWYKSRAKGLFEFDFDEDTCPMAFEMEETYCAYCSHFKECKRTAERLEEKKEDKDNGDLKY